MDLIQIESFVTVAETKSVSKAAEILFRSQPVVSRHIISLEKELGYELFEPGIRPMTLTAEGKLYLEGVQKSRIIMRETASRINALKKGYEGTLNICTHPGQLFTLDLVPVLMEFQEKYPRILVDLRAAYSGEITRRLQDGRCDCAYWRWEEYRSDSRDRLVFSTSKNGLLTLKDHPCSGKNPDELTLRDFSEDSIILLSEEFAPGLAKRMLRLCHEDHFDPKILIAPDLDTSLLWLSMNRGIIAVNSRAIARSASSFRFFLIPRFKTTDFCFIWEKDNPNPCLEVFRSFAQEYYRQHKKELIDTYL